MKTGAARRIPKPGNIQWEELRDTRDAQKRASVVVALRLQVEVMPTSNPLKVANVVVVQRVNIWLV